MKILAFVLLWVVSSASASTDNTAAIPTIRAGAWWMQLHEQYLEQAKQADSHHIGIAFYGDSITQFWLSTGVNVWKKSIAPLQADNFGIGGDRTQHLLWRIDNGELSGFHPRKIVLLIGTNNLHINTDENLNENSNDEIVEAVRMILHEMQVRQPQAQILLLSLTPRGVASDPMHTRIAEINEKLKTMVSTHITYVDLYSHYVDSQGTLKPELFLSDNLHFSEAGYAVEAQILVPLLK
jgi:lysophospholipase L1-like esterase